MAILTMFQVHAKSQGTSPLVMCYVDPVTGYKIAMFEDGSTDQINQTEVAQWARDDWYRYQFGKRGPGVTGSVCTYIYDETAQDTVVSLGTSTNDQGFGQRMYVPADDIEVCGLQFMFDSVVGDPSGQILTVGIAPMSGSYNRGAALVAATFVAEATYAGSWEGVEFGSPVMLSQGVPYALFIQTDTADASNYINVGVLTSDVTSGSYCEWTTGGTWTGHNDLREATFKLLLTGAPEVGPS